MAAVVFWTAGLFVLFLFLHSFNSVYVVILMTGSLSLTFLSHTLLDTHSHAICGAHPFGGGMLYIFLVILLAKNCALN